MFYYYTNGRFKALIPGNWIVQEEDDIISLYNPEEGVGALQFSLFSIENALNIDLKKELGILLENKFTGEIILKDNCAEAIYFNEKNNKYWRYWLIKNTAGLLIFGSYNSDDNDKEIEKDTVQEIIKSAI